MTRRQKAYFVFRGAAAAAFVLSITVLPRGIPAAIVAMVAGIGGILTCIGVNAGGPGERAGARAEALHYEEAAAPEVDWPPYTPERIVDGEVVSSRDRSAE